MDRIGLVWLHFALETARMLSETNGEIGKGQNMPSPVGYGALNAVPPPGAGVMLASETDQKDEYRDSFDEQRR